LYFEAKYFVSLLKD